MKTSPKVGGRLEEMHQKGPLLTQCQLLITLANVNCYNDNIEIKTETFPPNKLLNFPDLKTSEQALLHILRQEKTSHKEDRNYQSATPKFSNKRC